MRNSKSSRELRANGSNFTEVVVCFKGIDPTGEGKRKGEGEGEREGGEVEEANDERWKEIREDLSEYGFCPRMQIAISRLFEDVQIIVGWTIWQFFIYKFFFANFRFRFEVVLTWFWINSSFLKAARVPVVTAALESSWHASAIRRSGKDLSAKGLQCAWSLKNSIEMARHG